MGSSPPARSLRTTVAFPADDPRVKALVEEALDGETDPQAKADRLAHFVYNYLTYSSDDEPLNVLEAIERRRGDCSNYSTLYVTLCRAAGVPFVGVRAVLAVCHRNRRRCRITRSST